MTVQPGGGDTPFVDVNALPRHAILRARRNPLPRFFAAAALALAPIFLANLVFSQRFKDVASSTVAIGTNVLGAMFDGLLECVPPITGYRALLIGIAVLNGLSYASGRRTLRDLTPTAAR